MLAIRNFEKKYSGRRILCVPEIHFTHGAHWIQGDNGSGKSTFFKAIAGLIPYEGTIVLNGQYSHKKTPKQYLQRLTYCEAEPLYPAFLTPRDLLSFVASARKASKEELEYYSDFFQIDAYSTQPIQSCSSGMIKKVSLALAFLGDPQLIILDEPLITLDTHAQQKLLQLIKEKLRNDDAMVLLSSHQWIDNDITKSTYVIQNQTLERK